MLFYFCYIHIQEKHIYIYNIHTHIYKGKGGVTLLIGNCILLKLTALFILIGLQLLTLHFNELWNSGVEFLFVNIASRFNVITYILGWPKSYRNKVNRSSITPPKNLSRTLEDSLEKKNFKKFELLEGRDLAKKKTIKISMEDILRA